MLCVGTPHPDAPRPPRRAMLGDVPTVTHRSLDRLGMTRI